MLITEIGEIEDISDCFMYFPQFNDDFNILYSESIIKHTAFNRYDWTKSKTSLAEYFHWVGNNASYVTGGFWAPVAKTFTVKGKPATKRQLAKLAGNNANDLKPEESKDFKKIKELVLQYRKTVKQQAEQERKDRETFAALKTLMDKTEDKDIKQIRAALEKIKTVIS